MSKTKLLPCPFCGNNDRRVGIRRMWNKGYKVICGKCGGSGHYITIKDYHDNKMIAQGQAIKAWNTREPVENVLKRLEELKTTEVKVFGSRHSGESFAAGYAEAIRETINIITQELGDKECE